MKKIQKNENAVVSRIGDSDGSNVTSIGGQAEKLGFGQYFVTLLIKMFFISTFVTAGVWFYTTLAMYIVPTISMYMYGMSGLSGLDEHGIVMDFSTQLAVWVLPSLFLCAAVFAASLYLVNMGRRWHFGNQEKVIRKFLDGRKGKAEKKAKK